MKFKSYLIETEINELNEQIVNEGISLLKKISDIQAMIKDIKINDYAKTLSNASDFIKLTVDKIQISKIKSVYESIIHNLTKYTNEIIKLKNELSTTFFNSLIAKSKELIIDMKNHYKLQQTKYYMHAKY